MARHSACMSTQCVPDVRQEHVVQLHNRPGPFNIVPYLDASWANEKSNSRSSGGWTHHHASVGRCQGHTAFVAFQLVICCCAFIDRSLVHQRIWDKSRTSKIADRAQHLICQTCDAASRQQVRDRNCYHHWSVILFVVRFLSIIWFNRALHTNVNIIYPHRSNQCVCGIDCYPWT